MSAEHPPTTSVTVPLRYRDLDTLGHLNQSVYHVLLEESRVAFLHAVWDSVPSMVLARAEVDYRHEVRWSDRALVIETTIDRIGRSSITLSSQMRTPGGVLAASAVAVLVAWDGAQRRSRTLDDGERARLTAAQALGLAAPADA